MIRGFLCCLNGLHDNDNDVDKNGAVPRDIYEVIRPSLEGDVDGQVGWLVRKLLEQGLIELVGNDKVKITPDGRLQCKKKSVDTITGYVRGYCDGLGDCRYEYRRRREQKEKQNKQ
jgi:hypothetical protein